MAKAKTKSKKKEEIKDSTEATEQLNGEKTESKKKKVSVEDQLRMELEESKDKHLRLYSEFENFRRRTSKEKLDLISTANKNLMSDLIPVLDDFERAMTASESNDDVTALKEGMTLIQNKLVKSLENKGLKKMGVKKGDNFDDEIQEAITQIPAEKKLEGKVVDVVEPGYMLGETVVRFAKVVVGAKQ